MPRLSLLLFAAALVASACADAPPNSGCTPETPCGDEIVDGVNLSRLFAPPNGTERAAVREAWAARAALATGASAPAVSFVADGTDASGATVRVLVGVDRATGDTLFYAALRRPNRAAGDARRRPGLLVLPESPGDVNAADLPSQTGLSASLRDEVVAMALAARGAALTVGGRTFRSSAAGTPYVTDVDDAQTLLSNLTRFASEAALDASKVAAAGLGRGGTAALLLRARGAVPLAISFGAPTSWFEPSLRNAVRASLAAGTDSPVPDFESVMAAVVRPLQRREIDLPEARRRLLDRSPAPFLVPGPTDAPAIRVLAAHGTLDAAVPVDQAGALLAVLGTSGLVIQPEGATHASTPTDERVVSAVTEVYTERFGIAP